VVHLPHHDARGVRGGRAGPCSDGRLLPGVGGVAPVTKASGGGARGDQSRSRVVGVGRFDAERPHRPSHAGEHRDSLLSGARQHACGPPCHLAGRNVGRTCLRATALTGGGAPAFFASLATCTAVCVGASRAGGVFGCPAGRTAAAPAAKVALHKKTDAAGTQRLRVFMYPSRHNYIGVGTTHAEKDGACTWGPA